MTIHSKSILHQGVRRLWLSSGLDNTGISIAWANTLRSALNLLETAHSLAEIVDTQHSTVLVMKDHLRPCGFYIELNRQWRFTFDVEDPETGEASNLNIEVSESDNSS